MNRTEIGRYTPDSHLHTVVGIDQDGDVYWFVYDESGHALVSETTLQRAMDFLTYHRANECAVKTAVCSKCGATVAVRNTGHLASHNAPPNADGYIARCGNRVAARS